MTASPEPTAPLTPETLLPHLLGPLAGRLLAQQALLVFERGSGLLASAKQKALFDSGLDLDNPFKPSFAEMMGEAAESLWAQVLQGDEAEWSGQVTRGDGPHGRG